MAQHQLHNNEEARTALATGTEILHRNLPKAESGDLGDNWMDWIIAQALMREAKALIEGTNSPADALKAKE